MHPTIESGIPIPPKAHYNYAFLERLEIGDSFEVSTISKAQKFLCAAKVRGIKLTTRKTNNGQRLWRVPNDWEDRSGIIPKITKTNGDWRLIPFPTSEGENISSNGG